MTPWYHSFFHGLPQVAWKAAQTDEQTQLELELLVELLDFGPADRLLDIFCGYGRHALPIARMGAWITGVDISGEYVTELRHQATAESLPMEVIEGDFLLTPIPGTFDAAYCLGNSFSFFPPDVMLRFLKRIEGLLRPGGRFLAHSSMVAEVVLPDYQEHSWMRIGDDLIFLAENEYDALHGCVSSQLTYIQTQPNGQAIVETRSADHYIYTLAELNRLFSRSGFRLVHCFGTVDGQEFVVGDEAAWILAEKK